MGDPRIVVVDDAAGLAHRGADLVQDAVAAHPASSVVVATGRTPMGTYAELAARCRAGHLETSGLTVLQLDEYLGLERNDRRSLYGWMARSFLQPLGIDEQRVVRLPVDGDLDAACAAHDRMLEARGWPDLAILGLGTNGHLGFNEPPSDPSSPTRVVELSATSIEANARYWDDEVPPRAVTLGMRAILSSRTIVLLVAGPSKRAIVHRVLEGSVGTEVPATFLRETAADVTVVVERDAWGDG